MSNPVRKVYMPPDPLNTFRVKVAAKGSHAELFQSPADRAVQKKRFQSAVDRAAQETMRAKEIKRESPPTHRSKGGRRRTLKRGRKYSKKSRGRKSKKCGCSMLSFR